MPFGPSFPSVRSLIPAAIITTAAEWFSRRDAGLSAAEEREFQHWLAADSRHGIAHAELAAAWSVFGKPARTGAVHNLEQELSIRAARRRRRRLSATATALALLVAIGVFWPTPTLENPAESLPTTAIIFSPVRRVLPDGSVVLMKTGARITESFTIGMRRVELERGEAMFEVAHDRARPFVVSAGGIEVRAVGTAFAIDLGVSAVEVLITEGTVAIDKLDTARIPTVGVPLLDPPQAPAVVEAGHRVVFGIAPSANVPTVSPIPATELGERLAWRNRRVEFSGTTLAEAIAAMNREASRASRQKLVIEDSSLRAVRISGIFEADNTDAFVLLLEAGFGVYAERSGQEVKVRLRRAESNLGRR